MIELYWKNATSQVVGDQHGITPGELSGLSERMTAAQRTVDDLVRQGKLGFATLPVRRDYRDGVMKLVEKLRPTCSDLVVLGIGGSALGNIALQAALESHHLQPPVRQLARRAAAVRPG